MNHTLRGIVLTTVAAFSACSSGAQSIITRTEMDNVTVSANKNALSIYRGAAPRDWDMTHARVALSFDYSARTAKGEAWIKLRPNARSRDTLSLDAKNMVIESIAGNGAAPSFTHTYDGKKIKLSFTRALRPQDSIELHLRYTARPYHVPPGEKGLPSDQQGLYFINADRKIPGKPMQIWTQGETEENSVWLPMVDKPNERFTAQIELTVPDSFQTLSNGLMASSKPAGSGLRTDIWKIDRPIPAYTLAFAIGTWSVTKDSWNGREVSYYVEPAYAPYARKIFPHTPEMIAFFSQITGVPFAWPKYSQVVVRDFVSGAMENVSAVVFGEFVQQNGRSLLDRNYEDIVSHELFHHWFGDYVTAESWSNITVNESFANYGEQLWRKHYYGQESADELAWEDQRRYVEQTDESDPALVRYYYKDEGDLFDRISYEKGGAVLRYIHGLLGDSLFFKAMNLYLTKNALQATEAGHWRQAVEEASGLDWMPFFNQWYYRAGHPRLNIRHNYDDERQVLTVTIRQKSAPDTTFLYELPMVFRTITPDGRITDEIRKLRKRTEKIEIRYPAGQRPVVIADAEHWVPAEITEEGKTTADMLVQMKHSKDYVARRFALNLALRRAKDRGSVEVFRLGLQNDMTSVREYALQLLQRQKEKSFAPDLKGDVIALLRHEKKSRVAADAMDLLSFWKAKEVLPELYGHLSDSSYAAAGAALNAIRGFNADTAYAIAKRRYGNDNGGELGVAVLTSIVFQGNPADLGLLKKEAQQAYGRDKISLAFNIGSFAYATEDEDAYAQALEIIAGLARGEGIPSYRSNISTAAIQMLIIAKKEALNKEDKDKRRRFKARVPVTEKIVSELVADEKDEAVKARLTRLMNTEVKEE